LLDLSKKTELGVKRSKETWFGKIANIFSRGSFGDEIWEELEELLVSADVGVETTRKLMSKDKFIKHLSIDTIRLLSFWVS